MDLSLPDLSQCADEPIRVPGAIQPHGRMVVLSARDGHLVAYSENWRDRKQAEDVLGRLRLNIGALVPGEAPALQGYVEEGGQQLDVVAHRNNDLVIVELEPSSGLNGAQPPMYALARRLLPQLQGATSVLEVT